jgi:predicted transcriptional regulator
MKKLTISLKTPTEALKDFGKALKRARDRKGKMAPHYEIAFDNKKDFNRFVNNIFILMCIQSFHPKSVYELAKILDVDQSNLNKLINFFEELGAIRVEEKKVGGRLVRTPLVEYEKIEFDLKAA